MNASDSKSLELYLGGGDLSGLDTTARCKLVMYLCDKLGLEVATQPFGFIKTKDGKIKLYALKNCAEQLRNTRKISLSITAREVVSDTYIVSAHAKDKDGRTDEAIGAVPIKGLAGEDLSNAMMKAETKAKRRVTLSICGLGMIDDSEVDSIPGATRVQVEMIESPKVEQVAVSAVPPPVEEVKPYAYVTKNGSSPEVFQKMKGLFEMASAQGKRQVLESALTKATLLMGLSKGDVTEFSRTNEPLIMKYLDDSKGIFLELVKEPNN